MRTTSGDTSKRRLMALIIAVNMAPLSWAGPPDRNTVPPPPSAGGATTTDPKTSSATSSPKPETVSPVEAEMEQLKVSVEAESRAIDRHSKELESERAALSEELRRIAALEIKLGASAALDTRTGGTSGAAPNAAAAPALLSAPERQEQEPRTPQDLSSRVANLEDRLRTFGPFTFSGDIRLREEPFFGGPANGSLDQNRERFRLRFSVDAKLNDDFSGGFSLASGDVNDPTTTNQTVTGFYARKAMAIDRAFVQYTPHQFEHLTLIGGKFAYPWYNTELTWDKDLNPEGAAEVLSFDLKSTPALKKIAFVGFQLPLTQVAGVSVNDKSLVSSVVYGGQLQTMWQLAPWLKFSAFSGFYNFHNADPIALALAKANVKNPQTPLAGLLPLGTGSTVQNSTLTTTATNVVTLDGTAYPTGV